MVYIIKDKLAFGKVLFCLRDSKKQNYLNLIVIRLMLVSDNNL